jgi:hypothetical protein
MLVQHLPLVQPTMEGNIYINHQEWVLKQVIDSAHAEIFLRLAKPDGPVPLTEKLLAFCKEELSERYPIPTRLANDVETGASVSEWCDTADRRRDEFEFKLMREAIDKAADLMRRSGASQN